MSLPPVRSLTPHSVNPRAAGKGRERDSAPESLLHPSSFILHTFLRVLTGLWILAEVSVAAPPAGPVPVVDGIMLPRKRITMSLPVEARLRELRVEEGQSVHQGDVLAILYTESEELSCERAIAQLKKAESVYRSKLKLRENNGISEQELIAAEVDLELGKIELARSRAELRDKTLIAPCNGQILRVLKSAAETANRGEKIIELIDYAVIHVDVYLDAQYLTAVRQGQKAEVSSEAVGPLPVTATVLMVDPVVEPGSGLTRVRLQMLNPELRIPTGLPVKVRFTPAGLAAGN